MQSSVMWFEVRGKDEAALKKFYGGMFSWSLNFNNPMRYAELDTPEGAIGGGVGLDEQSWSTFYVSVEDVRAQVAQVAALGGAVRMPVRELPDGALIAVVSDPEGNAVGLFQPGAASA